MMGNNQYIIKLGDYGLAKTVQPGENKERLFLQQLELLITSFMVDSYGTKLSKELGERVGDIIFQVLLEHPEWGIKEGTYLKYLGRLE